MAIDLKSGETIDVDTFSDLQGEVSGPLNGGVAQGDLSRAVLGSDQLYAGAIRSAIQKEVLEGTIVQDHIKFPEVTYSVDWNHRIRSHADSITPVPVEYETQPVGAAHHRMKWQNVRPYQSTGPFTSSGAPFTGETHGFSMYDLKSGREGCSLFFYLNARCSTTYTRLNKKALVAGACKGGSRGWLCPVFFFRMNRNAPLLRYCPLTALGGWAGEFNGLWRLTRRFQDVEQIYSVSETVFLTRKSFADLAYFNGYYPKGRFNMGPSDPFEPLFGWSLRGGRDAFTNKKAPGQPVGTDLMALDSGHKDTNGIAFKVANGNVGYMAFDYVPDNEKEQRSWVTEGWGV